MLRRFVGQATIRDVGSSNTGTEPTLAAEIEAAVHELRRGGLVAFPTETVYGLGVDASNADAVARLFEVKRRPATHPLIVHLGTVEELDEWALDIPTHAHLLADAFWPGPLTMLVNRTRRCADAVTGGRDTVGLRVPDHPLALRLLHAFAGGIAAPSANRFGKVSPTTADHVRADLGNEVDLVLDGGPCEVGVESTIIDLTGDEPEVLRPGGVSIERLREVLGSTPRLWLGDGDSRAPGMLSSHYAPGVQVEVVERTEVVPRALELLDSGNAPKIGVLAAEAIAELPAGAVQLDPVGSVAEYARLLFARLRAADRLGLDLLLAVPPPDEGIGVAVRDRLDRAATRPREAAPANEQRE